MEGFDRAIGGLPTNIGIPFFDLLLWLFGEAGACEMHLRKSRREAGFLEFERARVRWFLSTDFRDLPFAAEPS